jgi:uncharacterized protein RhaS with RHS repeats
MGFAAGDTNLYRYVGNDPTNNTDPAGTEATILRDPLGGIYEAPEPAEPDLTNVDPSNPIEWEHYM